ncbi:MAG: hypothetical protein JSW47_12595, partial [Phycisphaerales bacterium]
PLLDGFVLVRGLYWLFRYGPRLLGIVYLTSGALPNAVKIPVNAYEDSRQGGMVKDYAGQAPNQAMSLAVIKDQITCRKQRGLRRVTQGMVLLIPLEEKGHILTLKGVKR